jgi:RHS repeat-associated protein
MRLRLSAVLTLGIACVASATGQCYQFSGSGVTLKVNITAINFQTGPTTVSGGTQTDYVTSGTNSLTLGGTTLTSISTLDGSVDIVHLPNIGSTPDTTSFTVSVPNGDPPGKGSHSWAAFLAGNGDLIPGQLLPKTLAPIFLWTGVGNSDYIQVSSGSTVTKYPITAVGSCSPASTGKALGIPAGAPGSCDCGDPINVNNGNLLEEVIDYRTATRNPLALIRYYNSLASPDTIATTLGLNWRTNYDRYIRINSPTAVVAERADGQEIAFSLVSGVWVTDSDLDAKLTNTGTSWTLTDRDDTVETYTTSGTSKALLQSSVARGGFTQTMQYDANGLLASVTDSYNRQLTFLFLVGKLLSVSTPDGLTVSYGYDSSNRLTSVNYSTTTTSSQKYLYENSAFPSGLTGVTDENGNRFATWTYDSSGRALSSQHAGGADLTSVAYDDPTGNRTVTNALGSQTVYKFTTLQGVLKITEADRLATATTPAAVATFTYDSNGYPASHKDWNGNTTARTNDVHGQPVSIVQASGTPQGYTMTVTYHPAFHVPVQVLTPGLTTSLTYDTGGNLLTVTSTDTTATTSPYSTSGQTRTWALTWTNFLPASIKTPRTDLAGLTKFAYDSSGALASVTNALNQVFTINQHQPGGLPLAVADANGVATSFTYDQRFRLLTRTTNTAAGAVTTKYSYDAAGSLVSYTAPDGSALNFAFDNAHRLTGVIDALRNHISFVLDALGDRTSLTITDPGGNPTLRITKTFDALGRLARKTGAASQVTAYGYDLNGNVTGVTDPLQHTTQRSIDSLNRVSKTTNAAGGTSVTTHDAHNRVTSIVDANGATTTYVYDGFGDLIQESSPSRGTIVFRYDSAGNMVQRTDARGSVANYTYDALNRRLTATYPADPAENVSYAYDQSGHGFGIGRLTSVTDAAGSLSRSYDERGNIINESRALGSATLQTAYTYDASNRVSSITYPSKAVVAYARNVMGQVSSISIKPTRAAQGTPVASAVTYQPFGSITALTFGNGVAETRSFDLDARVTGLSDGALQKLNYAYDAANNVLSITDGVSAANSQSFAYDSLNRLSQAAGGYGAFTYSYDANGNRLTASGSATPSSLDGLGSITAFNYNQAGRLASINSGAQQLTQYAYDAFGRRLAKQGNVTTQSLFQYDHAGFLLEETDGQGAAKVDYIYIDGRPVATLSADGSIYFVHNDRLGTPQLATDHAQAVIWSANYQPFGQLGNSPAGTAQDLRLPGQESDLETGLYHNGFRDFAPALGRYLQSDPVGLAGGRNTYAYADGNPLRFTDRLGLCDLTDWAEEWIKEKVKEYFGDKSGFDEATEWITSPETIISTLGVEPDSLSGVLVRGGSATLGAAGEAAPWVELGHILEKEAQDAAQNTDPITIGLYFSADPERLAIAIMLANAGASGGLNYALQNANVPIQQWSLPPSYPDSGTYTVWDDRTLTYIDCTPALGICETPKITVPGQK